MLTIIIIFLIFLFVFLIIILRKKNSVKFSGGGYDIVEFFDDLIKYTFEENYFFFKFEEMKKTDKIYYYLYDLFNVFIEYVNSEEYLKNDNENLLINLNNITIDMYDLKHKYPSYFYRDLFISIVIIMNDDINTPNEIISLCNLDDIDFDDFIKDGYKDILVDNFDKITKMMNAMNNIHIMRKFSKLLNMKPNPEYIIRIDSIAYIEHHLDWFWHMITDEDILIETVYNEYSEINRIAFLYILFKLHNERISCSEYLNSIIIDTLNNITSQDIEELDYEYFYFDIDNIYTVMYNEDMDARVSYRSILKTVRKISNDYKDFID